MVTNWWRPLPANGWTEKSPSDCSYQQIIWTWFKLWRTDLRRGLIKSLHACSIAIICKRSNKIIVIFINCAVVEYNSQPESRLPSGHGVEYQKFNHNCTLIVFNLIPADMNMVATDGFAARVNQELACSITILCKRSNKVIVTSELCCSWIQRSAWEQTAKWSGISKIQS